MPSGFRKIVRVAIHPAIGVARIGNSTKGFYITPETVAAPFRKSYRDRKGAILRAAARFRIYGFDADDRVVAELTADNAKIEWSVRLANQKASWYCFVAPLDLPDEAQLKVPRRNADVRGKARQALHIKGGKRQISGRNRSGRRYFFDGGSFQGEPVSLGNLRTDKAGRLLVLGGWGRSHSPRGTVVYDPKHPISLSNPDGWHDDVSDGPVTAKVSVNGQTLTAEPAWVVVAPPNYAPEVRGWRTMHDVLTDLYVQAGWLEAPSRPSFSEDVLPILRGLSNLQWVNKAFATQFGHGSPWDFADADLLAKLSQSNGKEVLQDPYFEWRNIVYNSFRHPGRGTHAPMLWPWLYGDNIGQSSSPARALALTKLQDHILQQWAQGNFIPDWRPGSRPPKGLNAVPLGLQPATLDKAALCQCGGDGLHPGVELGWPMRYLSLYKRKKPFRIRHARGKQPDYGRYLTAAKLNSKSGPMQGQWPGGLTRWLGLPWQVDAASCRAGYDAKFDHYLPTFWPARFPNEVLSEAKYRSVMDRKLSRRKRATAFQARQPWLKTVLTGEFPQQLAQMVTLFPKLPTVVRRPGIPNDADFPSVMYVAPIGDKPHPENGNRQKNGANSTAHAPTLRSDLSREELILFRSARFRTWRRSASRQLAELSDL